MVSISADAERDRVTGRLMRPIGWPTPVTGLDLKGLPAELVVYAVP